MRRFLIDGTVFEQSFTGVAKATLGLYQGLLEIDNGLEITILHRRALHGEIPATIETIQQTSLCSQTWRSVNLPLHAARRQYNVIHFPWNGGVPPSLPHRSLIVLTLHDVLPLSIPNYFRRPLKKQIYKMAVGQSLRRANLVITDSHFSQQKIIEEFQPRINPLVIYPASPLTAVRTLGTMADEKFFLFCGGYDKRKGIELLLKTFITLWRCKDFNIPLWLAGTPHLYSEYFANLLCEAKQIGAVKELGYVSDEALAQHYQNALALVYPSSFEGFGLPPLEAMTLGCPVITCALTSLPEVCGEAALYLDSQNQDELQNLILKLVRDEPLRKQMVEKGFKQAAKFSWRRSAEVFLQGLNQ